MIGKVKLGYPGKNVTLAKKGIRINRTCRQSNAFDIVDGVRRVEHLAYANLRDLLRILVWNEKHGIRVFRINSEILPHVSNAALLNGNKLAYPIEQFRPLLRQIGEYARAHGHRLTFHPGPFTILNAVSKTVWTNTCRELYWHARFLDLCGCGPESCVVIHGGGIYNDKPAAMARWITRYNVLPVRIRRRVVLENDETCFTIDDVLAMSAAIKPYTTWNCRITRAPVVFDIFHHACQDIVRARNNMPPQKPAQLYMSAVLQTWKWRPKLHISQQSRGRLGQHGYYVNCLPRWLLKYDVDVMVEAKAKEKAVKRLVANMNTEQCR